jgi:hypothetical protein
MSAELVSAYNGTVLQKPAGLSENEWKSTMNDLRKTEAGYLIKDHHPVQAENLVQSSSKTFAIPQSASIEFAADKAKREKAEAEATDKPSKPRGRPAKPVAAESTVE